MKNKPTKTLVEIDVEPELPSNMTLLQTPNKSARLLEKEQKNAKEKAEKAEKKRKAEKSQVKKRLMN